MPLSLFLCISIFITISLSNSIPSTNVFFNPPDERTTNTTQVYRLGDQITITWNTTDSLVSIYIVPQDPALTEQSVGQDSTTNMDSSSYSFDWYIGFDGTHNQPNIDLSRCNSFKLQLTAQGQDDAFATTVTFNITSDGIDAEGNKVSTSSMSREASSPTTTISIAPSISSTTLPTTNAQSGLSSSVKVGLGVGLGIGSFALAAGFGAAYLLFRRRKNGGEVLRTAAAQHDYDEARPKAVTTTPTELPAWHGSELPGDEMRHQLYTEHPTVGTASADDEVKPEDNAASQEQYR